MSPEKFLNTKLIRFGNTFITEVHRKETKLRPHWSSCEMQSTATLAKNFVKLFKGEKSYSNGLVNLATQSLISDMLLTTDKVSCLNDNVAIIYIENK